MPNIATGSIVDGVLHAHVAYDWGEEVDLNRAATLAPAESQGLARRPRTPPSIGYQVAPLRFRLPQTHLELPNCPPVTGDVEVTVFDFGAVSVRIGVPIHHTVDDLRRLAGDPGAANCVIRAARAAAEPLFEKLKPAINAAAWRDFSEEYFVFQLDPATVVAPERLLAESADWLAALVRMESTELSRDEVAEALKQRISYTPHDLVAVDWAAAVVVDRDCEETLQTIEFANVQLLEFRYIDRRLDDALARAYRLIHESLKSKLPFFRTNAKPLRALGDIKIETDMLLERAGNALKLVGDQYVARVYGMLGARFHLDAWSGSIQHSLEVVEGVYQILEDQASHVRLEVMELVVIGLITFEIVLSLIGH
jgi:hypothetical protein